MWGFCSHDGNDLLYVEALVGQQSMEESSSDKASSTGDEDARTVEYVLNGLFAHDGVVVGVKI